MQLLVEVRVENSLPVNDGWDVPHLSAVDLMPVLYLLGKSNSARSEDQQAIEWIEEDVFRATKGDDGKIKLEFPITADFDLLRFCVIHIIEGMIRAVVDASWSIEVYKRLPKTKGGELWTPQAQMKGPLKL